MGTTVFARGALLLVPGIVCILTSAPAWAEVRPLSLPQVIEHALHHNGDLNAFREEKGIRDAGKTRAGLLPNPTLELEGGTGALTGSSAENSLSFGVSQEFILSGKREKRLTLAERELEMYRWQLADRERLLHDEVKAGFYDLSLAEKRLALADSFFVLSVSPTRQRRDLLRKAIADKPAAQLWKFAAWEPTRCGIGRRRNF